MQAQTAPALGFIADQIGPYSLYWLHEEDDHALLAKGLNLEDAFERLLASADVEHKFERIEGVMVLCLGDGGYRVTSKLHNDTEAKREIMRAAVKHAWGEYKVSAE